MAKDDRVGAASAPSGPGEGGLDIHLRSGGLQLGEDEKSAGQYSWCRMSQGRSVSTEERSGQNGSQSQALMLVKYDSEASPFYPAK
jgi:hypothetical protein